MPWFVFAFGVPVFAVLAVFLLTDPPDRRRSIEMDLWRKRAGNPRKVAALPGPLSRMLATTGGGAALGFYELAPKIAYVAVMGADALQGSEHTTVVAKLDEPGPNMCVRPLPILEGERVPNTGVAFKKDDEFMGLFLVERRVDGEPGGPETAGTDKAIRAWLSPTVRDALLELPEVWLRVDKATRTMALTRYGLCDADKIDALVVAADIIFAEYGADGGPSLLLDESAQPAASDDEEDDEDDEDQDDEEEDDDDDDEEDVPAAKAKPSKPVVKSSIPAPTKPVVKPSQDKR